MAAQTEVGSNYLDVCRHGVCTGDANDEAATAIEGIQAVLNGRLPSFSQEYSCHSANEQRWFFMTVSPLAQGRQGAVIVHTNITERRLAEEQIRNLAYYDSLTRLPNRRLLSERLGQAIAANKRSQLQGAVMLLDLDNFKPLNDEHGHAVGDSLLIEVAQRLLGSVREVDTVARLGGDEFVVILTALSAEPAAAKTAALAIAEKIRATLAQAYRLNAGPEEEAGGMIEHRCSSSIGVTLFAAPGSQNEILRQADEAMYQAKAAGRNTICFFAETS